ncbi:MAG: Mu transposase C-terminal domain-containing protein [Candidatus Margulisiibacteriota bacterium]
MARATLVDSFTRTKNAAKREGRSKVEAGKTFINGYNTGNLHPQLYEILGEKSYSTLEGWRKEYSLCKDYTCLADRYGNRKGSCKVTDDEKDALLKFALHPNQLRISEVARLAKMKLEEQGLPSPSSLTTLRNFVINWQNRHYDTWVFCREGEKALNDKVLPYIERDINRLDVGDVLVADGHKLNFEILNPFTGKPSRMALILFYDWASCYPVGWFIMPTENIQGIAAALRNAILNLGKIPKVAYLDNGRAFKADVFTNTEIDFENAGFQGMFGRLGIEPLFAWPYHGQSKPVERFFGTMSEFERLMPTYTGTSIDKKPARLLRNEKLHKKIHEKKYGDWAPTIKEVDQMLYGWVEKYAKRPHEALKGRCPGDVFEAGKGPGIDEKLLSFLMLAMEDKTVHRNGIRMFGTNYYDSALYGYKDPVLVRYDLLDKSKVYVYDRTGTELICEAPAVRPVHPVARLLGRPEDEEEVKQGIEQKRRLKKETEKFARSWVETAPELIALPERTQGPELKALPGGMKYIPLTKAEAEKMEVEAKKIKVLEWPEKRVKWETESERYESYLERECKKETLTLDEMAFMRYYEKTDEYSTFKEHFDLLFEFFIAGPEKEESTHG